MKKTKFLVALLLVVCMLSTFVLAACGPKDEVDQLTYTEGTTLRMGAGYNNNNTAITYRSSGSEWTGKVKDKVLHANDAANDVTATDGQLKPTWKEASKRLGITFEDVYQGKSTSDEADYWKTRYSEVDVFSGTAAKLQAAGANGDLIDISQYLDKMPNFKAYLDANPIVRLSITGSASGSNKGAIYMSPYFDGVDDIERMPLMRIDWVEKLLNGTAAFTATDSNSVATTTYTAFLDGTNYTVDGLNAAGTAVVSIAKKFNDAKTAMETYAGMTFSSGNIVIAMNEYVAAGSKTGVQLVNLFRAYIDGCYGATYTKETRAQLFTGYNAAWDADELVALLRCVKVNSKTLNGTTTNIAGLIARDGKNTSRLADLYRLAGVLFGVRGLESRQDFLYFDSEGVLHDARLEEDAYVAISRMNQLFAEGLIDSNSFTNTTNDYKGGLSITRNEAFMEYDYSQTQTLNSDKIVKTDGSGDLDTTASFSPVMVPVSLWHDGTNIVNDVDKGVFMRFTESWRSVKTDGWALSKAGIGNDQNKLYAALKLIDYAYSEKGQILFSYGPDDFIAKSTDTSANNNGGKYGYEWFKFNGQWAPVVSAKTIADCKAYTAGNYTDFARFLLGSTLTFVKMQSFEYQMTNAAGREGAGKISAAIALGTIKHPLLSVEEDNMWYTSVPTVFPMTNQENNTINTLDAFMEGDNVLYSAANKTTTFNVFVDLIKVGFNVAPTEKATELKLTTYKATPAEMASFVSLTLGGQTYLFNRGAAWTRLIRYYNTSIAK